MTTAAEHPRSSFASVIEFVLMLAAAVVLATLLRTFVVEPFRIPSGSMIPAIEIGDQVIVNKFVYRFGTPRYGDVVILDDPTGETPMLIKRVIAVGGQSVDVRDGKVWVDGEALTEPYTYGQPNLPGSVTLPITLPADTVWVMGDNRMHSKDSRWLGPQPFSAVHGRAFVTYWPPGRLGPLK
ncbi:MAG: signal peptidase I [Coriobacteriia bacterium]|nr:signal peptidase I [Coriobacteriia bacterium]